MSLFCLQALFFQHSFCNCCCCVGDVSLTCHSDWICYHTHCFTVLMNDEDCEMGPKVHGFLSKKA